MFVVGALAPLLAYQVAFFKARIRAEALTTNLTHTKRDILEMFALEGHNK